MTLVPIMQFYHYLLVRFASLPSFSEALFIRHRT